MHLLIEQSRKRQWTSDVFIFMKTSIIGDMNRKDTEKRNIRDLSYLSLEDGRKLKEGFFFRSGPIRKFTRKGIEELKEANLKTVIDLRTDGETAKKPDVLWGGVNYHSIPLVKEETIGITHERGLKAYKKPPVMTDLYAAIVASDESVDALRKIFDIIFDPKREGAVLWHCTAGKDRCGIVSALFLLALGYQEADIFEDYLRSDKQSEKKGKLYRFLIRALLWKKDLAQGVYEAMRAKKEYLRAAIDQIKKSYGDVHSYLSDRLGLTKERIDSFITRNMVD